MNCKKCNFVNETGSIFCESCGEKMKNKDVVFIGNINYHPNKIACFEFISEIMPKLKSLGVDINFVIIGIYILS